MGKYKFNLYNIFRFHRNTNIIKQQQYEDKLKYLEKSDNSINTVTAKLDGIAKKAYNDEGKSYGSRSPYKMLLTALIEVKNFMMLYLLRAINNNNILTSDNINATKGLASLSGFEAINMRSAVGSVLINIKSFDNDTSTLFIQNGAQIINKNNGMQYFIAMKQDFEQFHIRYDSAIVLTAVQGVKNEDTFTGSGEPLQTYHISNTNIDDSFLEVYLDEVRCTKVNKLSDMHFNDNAFTVRNSLTGGINIIFGNGVNGKRPKIGSKIKVMYVTCDGEDGATGANEEFEFVNGVLDKSANYVDTRNLLAVSSFTDFIGGYNGDTIKEIALNAGLQTPSDTLVTVDNYFSFMRKYTGIKVVDAWSEPSVSSTTNLLVMPNLRSLCERRLNTYFDLEYSDFEMDTEEISLLHSNIVSDRKYALMSNLNIYQYKLIPFGILVFARTSKYTVSQNVYNKVISVIHNTLLNELDNNSQLIRASKIINDLQDNVDEMSELFVKFVGESKYINDFGDIDTQNYIINDGSEDYMVLPYIFKGTYDNVDFADIPVKIMSKSNSQWIELNYTQN